MTAETVDQLSTAELEAILARKKAAEKAKKEQARKAYEANRDSLISHLIAKAREVEEELKAFKEMVHKAMDEQAIALGEYGGIRSNSKGGFSITSSCGNLRVTRRLDTVPQWDERGEKAISLIKEFLGDTVKKRDKKLFGILISFLERNKAGDLEYAKVYMLLQHEDKYTDERWVEGLSLLKESYHLMLKGFAYELKVKDHYGKWQTLNLNFSAA